MEEEIYKENDEDYDHNKHEGSESSDSEGEEGNYFATLRIVLQLKINFNTK